MPTSTVENYLKTIWFLQSGESEEDLVPIGGVAGRLEVTPGTATTMMNQLVKQGLVNYIPRRGVRLNEAGRKAALRVLRRHRLVETFLVQIMKLDWAEVHEDAEVLEHVISDRLLNRMDEMLNHPTHDPHGAPIPDHDGKMASEGVVSLAECQPGHYTLRRVREDEPSFLQWLAGQGLRPGVGFELSDRNAESGVLELHVPEQDHRVQISLLAARSLTVSHA